MEIPISRVIVLELVLIPAIVNAYLVGAVPSGKIVVVTPAYPAEHPNGRLCRNNFSPIVYEPPFNVLAGEDRRVIVPIPATLLYRKLLIPVSSYPQVQPIPESLTVFPG